VRKEQPTWEEPSAQKSINMVEKTKKPDEIGTGKMERWEETNVVTFPRRKERCFYLKSTRLPATRKPTLLYFTDQKYKKYFVREPEAHS